MSVTLGCVYALVWNQNPEFFLSRVLMLEVGFDVTDSVAVMAFGVRGGLTGCVLLCVCVCCVHVCLIECLSVCVCV